MFKKILSYFWTITKRLPSDYSGELEVSLYRGKKVLDTKNANYSYGTLQKIMEKGIDQIDLSKVETILILGMGAGSVIESLRQKYQYNKQIDAIEIDAKIIEIAKNDFGITTTENTNIINDDALTFLEKTSRKYNLIIVDIFIDTKVPKQFYEIEFAHQLTLHLLNKGAAVFNLGMDLQKDNEAFNILSYFEKIGFEVSILEKVERFNTILIAKAN